MIEKICTYRSTFDAIQNRSKTVFCIYKAFFLPHFQIRNQARN